MGSDPASDADTSPSEQPQHRVVLSRYYMARYPVTVAQFQTFVEASGYHPTCTDSLHGQANHPVVWVNWHDALAYCDWLTKRLRTWPPLPAPLAEVLRYDGGCVALPSEAEWEKAARGTDGLCYPRGIHRIQNGPITVLPVSIPRAPSVFSHAAPVPMALRMLPATCGSGRGVCGGLIPIRRRKGRVCIAKP
jgi:hypothetical protein